MVGVEGLEDCTGQVWEGLGGEGEEGGWTVGYSVAANENTDTHTNVT